MTYKNETLYSKANKELKKVVDFIESHKDAFNAMNLKLYDAFSASCDNGRTDDFYNFCDFEYDCMVDYFKENCIDFKPDYIGHTSTFCLDSRFKYCHFGNDEIAELIYNMVYDFGYDYVPDITDACKIDPDNFDDCIDNIEYIASGGFYKDFLDSVNDTMKVYEYIKSFKNNQVAAFDEYCSFLDEIA